MAQRRSTSRRTARWLIAAWLGSFYLAAPRAYSFPYELSFAHRLTDGKGVPLEGPIDVRIDFYTDEIGDSRIDISPINQGQVTLNDGVFQLSLTLTPPEFHRVFAVNSSAVFIQITDVTHSKTYQRQQFTATPYALKVPIDEKALSYNSDGQLTLGTSAARPTSGQVLSPDSTGKLVWTNFSTLSSQSMTAVPPSEGQVLTYTGGSWVPQSLSGSLPVQSGVTAGTYSKANVTVNSEGIITSVGNGSSVNLDTETTGVLPASRGGTGLASTATFPSSGTIVTRDAAETLQNKTFNETRIEGDLLIKGNGSAAQLLKFFDATNSNYVALRSPAIVSHFQAYTLPASDGLTGSLLTTDGSGQWSWVSGATPTGNATGDLTGSFPNPTLTATGVTAGTYSRVVVDSKGRVNTGLALSVADIPSLPTSILGSGTIPVERGGTGGSSFTANGVLIGAGPNALTSTNAGQSDQILTVDSTGAPAFGAVNLSSANAITGLLPKANGGLGFDTSSLTVPTNGTLITSGGIATLSNKTLSSPLIQEGTVSNAIVTTNRPMSVASDSGLTLLPYDTTNGGTTELRFGSTIPVGNYLGFKAPANVSTNRVWTLPPSDGSANWVLTTNGSGSLSWTSKSSTDLGGDSFDQTNKAAGKVIKWDGSKYYLADDIVGATGSSGIQTLNGLNAGTQSISLEIGGVTTPTVNADSTTNTHRFKIPMADTGGTTAGLLSKTDYDKFDAKISTVFAGSGITVNTNTTTHTATVAADTGTTAGKLVQLDANGYLPAVNASALTNLNPINLSSAVPVSRGGTGLTSGNSGGIPYFNSTTSMASSNALTSNGVVLGGGVGMAPKATAAGTNYTVLRVPASGGAPNFGSIDLTQSAAVAGTLSVANGGTGANLQSSGGTGQYLKQTSSGAAVSVGTIAAADLPVMAGDNGTRAGTQGTVPAPALGDAAAGKYLGADGSWSVPPNTKGAGSFTGLSVSGNVGIGTTAPGQVLHVSSSAISPFIFIDGSSSTTNQAGLKMIAGNGTTNRATRIDFLNAVSSSTVPRWTILNDFGQNGTNDFGIVDSSTNRVFTILQGGSVGIGTTSPSSALQIGNLTIASTSTPSAISLGGTFSSTAGANPKLKLLDATNNGTPHYYGLGVSGSQLDLMVPTGASFVWYTNSSETMRLNGSGNLGIGSASPSAKLDVNGEIKTSSGVNFPTGGVQKTRANPGFLLMERFAAGTMGAAPTALSWNVRRLNVEAFDTLDQVILDSSTYRFTLPAGKYYCEASGPARDVDHHKLRLRNVTNNTTLILGRSHYNGTSSSIFDAVLAGTFTLTSSVSIELQHYTQSAPSSAYLGDPTGTAASIGESYEIYATLHCYSYD